MPPGIREDTAAKSPFLAIDYVQGLVAMVWMSAIELHVWGATEAEPLRPDQLVFDLYPGEGVKLGEIVAAALDIREQLRAIGLTPFCRTSGGKSLHVVVPLRVGEPCRRRRSEPAKRRTSPKALGFDLGGSCAKLCLAADRQAHKEAPR